MKRMLAPAITLLVTALIVGLAPGFNSAVQAQIVDVSIEGFAFNPDDIVIDAGMTVRWTNNDAVAHTATSTNEAWDSGNLSPGESFSVTLPVAGDYPYICTLHPSMSGTITVQEPTDVDDREADQLPRSFDVRQNYPNPFNPATTIPYSLPTASRVQVEIFNSLGQRVAIILDRVQPAGDYTVEWDGTDESGAQLASGIYLYRISTGNIATTRKMILLK